MSGYGSVDDASDVEAAFLDEAIAKHRERHLCFLPNNMQECIDCEDPIGTARKLAIPSCIRCITCQSQLEKGK